MVTSNDLFNAARVMSDTMSPEDCGIDPEAIREFIKAVSFHEIDGTDLDLDDLSLVYGICLGVLSATWNK